jgi:glycosyltransferase involved in cell wall biosynthesis
MGWLRDLRELSGLEVHAVGYEPLPLGDGNIRQYLLSPPVRGKIGYLLSGHRLREAIREIQPDVLVAYRVMSYGFAAAASGFHPLVVGAHEGNTVYPKNPRIRRHLTRYALRRADLIHTCEGHMEHTMRQLGANPSRIRVLHLGVRTDILHPGDSSEKPPRIIASLQLDPDQGTDLILRAVSELRSHGLEVELWIVGEGSDRDRLEGMVVDLHLQGVVRFLGRLRLEEMAEAYRQASIYASMVPTDGASDSLLEAMSSGLLPVVVDNEVNRNWITTGRDGVLVSRGDVSEMARGIFAALTSQGELVQARERNRKRICMEADRKINMGKMVKWWEALVAKRNRSSLIEVS